jgi:co-chaperonin GroES (HSP10)
MFTPTNRNLLLELKASEQEEQTGVLLPEGFQKVVAVAQDCNTTWKQGSYIVFPSNMLQQVEVNGRRVSLVSENYVLGYVEG